MSLARLSLVVGSLVGFGLVDVILAETVIKHEQTVQRGTGSFPAIHIDGDDVFAAVRGGNGQFVLFHLEPNANNELFVRRKIAGTNTQGHDVTRTLWDTVITATLQPDEVSGDGGGALTLDSFLLTDSEAERLHRHRALPTPPTGTNGGIGGLVVNEPTNDPGPQFAPRAAVPPDQAQVLFPQAGNQPPAGDTAVDNLTGEAPLGVYASAVALEDISIFTADGGLQKERIATAILDRNGELQIDTWELNEAKQFSHLYTNDEAGRAHQLATTRWNQGIITALIDSDGQSRFIAWQIMADGRIVRKSTARYGPATEIDLAQFSTFDGEDRYTAAIRHSDGKLRVMLARVGNDGTTQRIVAQGIGPAVKRVSITPSADFESEASGPDSFFTVSRNTMGKMQFIKWFLDGQRLTQVAETEISTSIAEIAVDMYPHFGDFDDAVDVIISLAIDDSDETRIDLSTSVFHRIPAAGAITPDLPEHTAHGEGLLFSANSMANAFEGRSYPNDMPDTNMPHGFNHCSSEDERSIRAAWRHAHYLYFRADQVMHWLKENGQHRQGAWSHNHDRNIGSVSAGFTNYNPRAWFGKYDKDRFHKVIRTIRKIANDRFRDGDYTVRCRRNPAAGGASPCFTNDGLGALHSPPGTINFCNNFFRDTLDARRNLDNRAQLIAHEIGHWLKIPKSGGQWLSDRHDFWKRCGIYRSVRVMYGDDAAFLANTAGCRERNFKRAVRNVDNYALFATELGTRVYDGALTEFPEHDFWN